MATKLRQRLRVALEEIGEELRDRAALEDKYGPDCDNVDLALSIADQSHAYAQDAMADAETVEDVATTLEAIATALESAIAQGGLGPQAAGFANLAIQQQYDRVGIEVPTLGVENFGGTKPQLVASQETLVGVREQIQRLWESMKLMVQRMWNAMTTFFAHLFDSARLMAAAAEQVIARARAVPVHQKPRNTALYLSDVDSRTLAVGVRIDWNIPSGLSGIAANVANMTENLTSRMRINFEGLVHYIENPTGDAVDHLYANVMSLVHCPGFTYQLRSGHHYAYSKDLPGNRFLSLTMEQINEDAFKGEVENLRLRAVANMLDSTTIALLGTPGVDTTKIVRGTDCLDQAGVIRTAEAVKEIARWSMEFNKTLQQLSREQDEAMRKIGSKIFHVGQGEFVDGDGASFRTERHQDGHHVVIRLFRTASQFLVRPAHLLSRYNVTLARSALTVAQKSLLELEAGTRGEAPITNDVPAHHYANPARASQVAALPHLSA